MNSDFTPKVIIQDVDIAALNFSFNSSFQECSPRGNIIVTTRETHRLLVSEERTQEVTPNTTLGYRMAKSSWKDRPTGGGTTSGYCDAPPPHVIMISLKDCRNADDNGNGPTMETSQDDTYRASPCGTTSSATSDPSSCQTCCTPCPNSTSVGDTKSSTQSYSSGAETTDKNCSNSSRSNRSCNSSREKTNSSCSNRSKSNQGSNNCGSCGSCCDRKSTATCRSSRERSGPGSSSACPNSSSSGDCYSRLDSSIQSHGCSDGYDGSSSSCNSTSKQETSGKHETSASDKSSSVGYERSSCDSSKKRSSSRSERCTPSILSPEVSSIDGRNSSNCSRSSTSGVSASSRENR